MKRILTIAVFLTMALALSARAQVSVRLQQPPPNQLKVADMWRITIVNSTRETKRVYLQGTVTETRDGQVVDAQSAQFDIPPGSRMVTGRDVEPVKVNSSNSKYKNIVLATGTVPSGEYTICVYVKEAKGGATLGSDCITQTIQNVSLVLISPNDESRISDDLPMFNWTTTPLMGSGARYTVRFVEIVGDQSPYNSMRSGRTFYEKEDVVGQNFQYPVSAPKLVAGKEYAWQVTAFSNGVQVSQSEVWSFTYGKDAIIVAPKDIVLKLPSKFEKAYGGGGIDQAYSIRQTKDSGYIIAGYTGSFGAGRDDVYLVKTDVAGVLQWSRAYGGENDEAAYDVEQTADGGYIAVGYTRGFNVANSDVYVVKTDAKGNLEWSKTYGGGGNDAGYSIRQTQDGGFIVGGILDMGDDYNGYLLRLNGSGGVRWSRNFGGGSYDIFKAAHETRGGFLAAGYTRSFGMGNDDAYLVFVNDEGVPQWATQLGNLFVERGYSISEPHGTMFVVTGYLLDAVRGFDVLMASIDRSGAMGWQRAYHVGVIDECYAATPTKDGGVVAVGYSRGSAPTAAGGVYMIKVNTDGTTQWSRLYQGAAVDDAAAITATFDQGFAVVGWTGGVGAGDALLIKTDMQGEAGCNEIDPKTEQIPARIVASSGGSLFGVGANVGAVSATATPVSSTETAICPK